MKWFFLVLIFPIMQGCDLNGTSKKNETKVPTLKKSSNTLNTNRRVVLEEKLDNGERIEWFERGQGAVLKEGDLAMIDYRVELPDGSVVDGNHLLKMKAFPYLIGFQMQLGWDAALTKLRVGDFAKISIPSRLARGEKGVDGLIPKNADNYLIIRVMKIKTPTSTTAEGVKIWLLEENKKNKMRFNAGKTMTIHSMVSSPSNPLYYNSYRENKPFVFRFEDNGIVPGLKKALTNAKKADRLYIYIPSSEAYGSQGFLDIVKPNEPLFYNLLVLDVRE